MLVTGLTPHVNLHGMTVGDGWVDPLVADSQYPAYAYAHGLLDLPQKQHADGLWEDCKRAIVSSLPVPSRESDLICNRVEDYIVNVSGGVDVYDVRRFDDPFAAQFALIKAYLNNPEVRQALHISEATPQWEPSSGEVGFLLERGEQGSVITLYADLLRQIRVLIYNGVFDMDCNFMGTDAWLERLPWRYKQAWQELGRTPWLIPAPSPHGSAKKVVAGHQRSLDNLTQLTLLGAGHLVPGDQPRPALLMMATFLKGAPFSENMSSFVKQGSPIWEALTPSVLQVLSSAPKGEWLHVSAQVFKGNITQHGHIHI